MTKRLAEIHLKTWRQFITAHTLLIGRIDDLLSEAGQIPLNWYDVLIELYEAPDSRLRMSDLADRVLLTRSGLTRLVDRLEKEGYLTRELDPEDRRGFYAIITPAGVEAMRGAWSIYAEGIATLFAEGINDHEAEVLIEMLNRMINRVRQTGE